MNIRQFTVLPLLSILYIEVNCLDNGLTNPRHQPRDVVPCGDSMCECSKKGVAKCANWGANLTFIPKLPSSIHELVFINNSIQTVSRETFENVTSFHVLKLRSNGILNITGDAFLDLATLGLFGIEDNNRISKHNLANSFKSLQTQSYIQMILSNISLVDLSTIFLEKLHTKKVKSIDVSRNFIEILDLDVFYHIETLKKLLISSCRIWNILVVSGHRNLEELDISKNYLRHQPALCNNSDRASIFPMLQKLHLQENVIQEFSASTWNCLQRLQYLDLSNNRIHALQTNAFSELGSLTVLLLTDMYKGISKIEKAALNSTTLITLQLDGNYYKFKPIVDRDMFVYCPNVKRLFLSRNNFYYIDDTDIMQMFSPLKHLTDITIKSAYMRLPVGLLELFPNLTRLNLASNRYAIYDVGASFKNTQSLKVLSLQDNSIKVVSQESFNGVTMGSVQFLNLADNPFSCSCEMLWFRNVIGNDGSIGNIKLEGWPKNYSCAEDKRYAHESYPLFINYTPSTSSCENKHVLLSALICEVSLVVLITIIVIAVYKYRWYIAYWTYKTKTKCSSLETQPLLNNDGTTTSDGIVYDGYVIYSDDDRKFVHNDLRLLLEVQLGYKLHIWERDASAGQAKVTVIADAIYTSRHVLAVASEKVLNDTWFQFQLSVALDRQLDLKRDFLILILLEDIKYEHLSKFWCVMLTRLLCTRWCSNENDVKRRVFEQQIEQQFSRNRAGNIQ